MDFDFGNVLRRAWQIIWKHKVLWIFGIFAGCSRGGGSGGGGGGGGSGGEGFTNQPQFGDQIERSMDQLGRWIEQNLWIIIVLVVAFLLLILITIFLGTIGRVGLIRGTYQAESGIESLSFGSLFQESLPFFWRVLGLSLLVGLAFLIVFIPIILFGILTAGVGFACLLPLICVLIPITWAVMAVIEQANAAIVIENLGILAGLQRGWEICRSNLGPIIIMALILWIGSAIVGIVIAIPILVPILLAVFGLATSEGDMRTPLLIAGICFVIYLPVLILLSGILTAYIQSAWALTFIRLAKPPESSSIVDLANA